MPQPKLIVRYQHKSDVLSPIYLSYGNPGPNGRKWTPAYRDTINGERVVWIRVPNRAITTVWLSDDNGQRPVSNNDVLKG